MLKRDLLALIAHLPDDADIRVAIPTHDHWRSVLAGDIQQVAEEVVSPSSYHNDEDKIRDPDDHGDDSDDLKTVHVLW